ncbi:hypothetical protein Tco_0872485 [Tanacetum coccineum]
MSSRVIPDDTCYVPVRDASCYFDALNDNSRFYPISNDPYEEAARQLLEQALRPSEYVPDPMELKDHVLVYILEPEHLEDLVPAKDEEPIEPYITKQSWLRGELQHHPYIIHYFQQGWHYCYLYHYLHHPLAVKLTFPRLTRHLRRGYYLLLPHLGLRLGRALLLLDTVDTRVRDTDRRTMAAVEVVNLRVSYQTYVRRRESLGFYSRHQEVQEDRAAVRAEIKILRRERLAYEQGSIETRQALARSEAYSRALEARIEC